MTISEVPASISTSDGAAGADESARRESTHRSPMPLLDHGLGHDLRNLVMPVLLRIDTLTASENLSDKARDDLAGIRRSITQIQRLADGLRLISSDPLALDAEWQVTQLPAWWADVRALVNDTLPPHAFVTAHFSYDLPGLRVPPAVLAQAVIQLLVDTRAALQHVLRPSVTLRAIAHADSLELGIEDNRGEREGAAPIDRTSAPGVHCSLSGAECAARSLLRRYGGDVLPASSSGALHTVRLRVPLANHAIPVGASLNTTRVAIQLADPRHVAIARVLIPRRGMRERAADDPQLPDIVLCDAKMYCDMRYQDELLDHTRRGARLLVVGDPHGEPEQAGVQWIDPRELARLGDFL